MVTKTRIFLEGRRDELKAEIEAAAAPFRAELEDVEAALAAIRPTRQRLSGETVEAHNKATEGPGVIETLIKRAQEEEAAKSYRQQIVQVLRRHPKGLTVAEVTARIRGDFGRDANAQNVSWHLSAAKRDAKQAPRVLLEDDRWKLEAEAKAAE